jgi:very-short-patch-repair endonuclease|tara:strand:+ start:3917 stop:4303 length:387 start_codon:yes stop_codon:yes gene_type:complete
MSTSSLEEKLLSQIGELDIESPLREQRFHPTRKWRFDFYWPDLKIACEVEGGIWISGRHNRPISFIKDAEKYNEAALMGIKVLRVTDKHIKDGSAIDWIRRIHGCEHISVGERGDILGNEAVEDPDPD